jgi:hypothetical protein
MADGLREQMRGWWTRRQQQTKKCGAATTRQISLKPNQFGKVPLLLEVALSACTKT